MELKFFSFYKNEVYSRQLLWNGFIKALDLLLKDYQMEPEVDHLAENWAQPGLEFEDAYGTASIWIEDEERKINLNYASREILQEVLPVPEFPSELVPSIIDWRDEDEVLTPGGAEQSYYDTLDFKYRCRNGPLKSLQELNYIRGGEELDLASLSKKLTLAGEENKVNINTVNEDCLSALGRALGFLNLVEYILAVRENHDYFEDLSAQAVSQKIYDWTGYLMSDGEKEKWEEEYRNYFKVNSQFFRILIKAESKKGLKRYALAVVKRNGSQIELLSWREDFWMEEASED